MLNTTRRIMRLNKLRHSRLVQNQEVRPVDTAGSVNNTTHTTDLVIPPYVDPNTNKPILEPFSQSWAWIDL